MVTPRTILTIITLIFPLTIGAQRFPVDDTITEYPHKGTFYHDKFEGRKTANGEIFDQNLFTAAHWKIKLGTYVMVTNRNTGLQVIVRVNDRCPKRGVFDLSHRAANSIGIKGCQPVTVRILPESEEYIERWKSQDGQFDSVHSKFRVPSTIKKNETQIAKKDTVKTSPKLSPKPPRPAIPDLPHASSSGPRYNLSLCKVASHGAAFSQIQKLPQSYQDKILIDIPDSDTAHLHLILDVNLSKNSAQELGRALKPLFPDCKTIPSE